MNKNLVKAINTEKENYNGKLASVERKDLAGKIDILWKNIRMDEYLNNAEALHKNVVGEETTVAYEDGFNGREFVKTSMDEYEEEVFENGKAAVTRFIAIYEAAKEALNKRSFRDKLFHPIQTYRENKTFEQLKEALEVRGITDEMIESYHQTNEELIPIDEALNDRLQVNIQEDEKMVEVEPFEKSSIAMNLEAVR